METVVVEFEKGVNKAIEIIENGGVIACATDTVYGLSCDPFSKIGVDKIYELKNRERNMPLLLVANKNFDISKLVYIDERARQYTEKYWPGAVTFVFKIKDDRLKEISCGKDTIAIRKPNNKIFNYLLEKFPLLTSTSANLSGSKVATSSDEVLKYFNNKIPLVLDCGKSSEVSSTLVDLSGDEVKVLRQGSVVID